MGESLVLLAVEEHPGQHVGGLRSHAVASERRSERLSVLRLDVADGLLELWLGLDRVELDRLAPDADPSGPIAERAVSGASVRGVGGASVDEQLSRGRSCHPVE